LRKIVSIAAISLLLASGLAGCTSSSKSAAADTKVPVTCKSLATGNNVSQVTVATRTAAAPTVKFPLPLKVGASQRKILKQGNGTMFGGGQLISFDFAGYNARTGELFQATKYDGSDQISQLIASPTKDAPASVFCNVFSGARAGATVVALLNAQDSHNGQAIDSANIKANDPLLFVLHLRKVNLPRAIGKAEAPKSGFPQVVLASTGEPGLVMQDWSRANAPTEFKKETLIKGSGQVVRENDTVTVHYSGFLWDESKTQFDSSWKNGNPATFQLSKGSVIPGFISALAGETVGSQVVAVLPPSVAYGSQGTGSIPANATLIFVIDILGAGK
jgi:peptidylprolyl isomerase